MLNVTPHQFQSLLEEVHHLDKQTVNLTMIQQMSGKTKFSTISEQSESVIRELWNVSKGSYSYNSILFALAKFRGSLDDWLASKHVDRNEVLRLSREA